MRNQLTGFLLLAMSGIVQSLFAWPVPRFQGWRWEQMWIAQAITANLLIPGIWLAALPRAFWTFAATLPLAQWLALYVWGLAWGIGGVAYGIALTRLGASFAYSFVFGVTTVSGSLLPLVLGVVRRPADAFNFASGLLLSLVCIIASALAIRGAENNNPALPVPIAVCSLGKALFLGFVAGVFSASYGLAFSFTYKTIERAAVSGLTANSATMVVALPLYLGSASFAIPFGLACAGRSRSTTLLWAARPLHNWGLALLMAIFGVGGVFLYGVGAAAASRIGPNVSFGIAMSFFVLGGNMIGVSEGIFSGQATANKLLLLVSVIGLVVAAWLLHAS